MSALDVDQGNRVRVESKDRGGPVPGPSVCESARLCNCRSLSFRPKIRGGRGINPAPVESPSPIDRVATRSVVDKAARFASPRKGARTCLLRPS